MSIIVDRTLRAGEKLIDKSLGLSIDETNELYISIFYRVIYIQIYNSFFSSMLKPNDLSINFSPAL